jgi:hypothetical protein
MAAAIRVYERLRLRNEKLGLATNDDYVFVPKRHTDTESDSKKRDAVLKSLQQQFRVVLELTNLLTGPNGEERSLYSLRHTSIMLRLLYRDGVDHLTLARNARTSVDMLERFYVSHLTGEMNIDLLQSKRSRTKHSTL